MCYPTPCPTCGKTTWAGCGRHIDQVKAQVPASQWCTCQRTEDAEPPQRSGLLGLFTRR